MSSLKKQLIKLGSTNPALRPNIKAILASVEKRAGVKYVEPRNLNIGDTIMYNGRERVIEKIEKVNAPRFENHGSTRWTMDHGLATNLAMDPAYKGLVKTSSFVP